ncbi:MAG: DNA recombination protein RmuC [Sphingobacteriales bacterium]|nr:DNA recombination protein RmuC [Sphingobacteriales bacterium]
MSTFEMILITVVAFLLGALFAWQIVKARWTAKLALAQGNLDGLQRRLDEQSAFYANSEKEMREAFGSLAADALQKNNHAFVSLAESRLNEKVIEAKGSLETKEKAIEGLVAPLKNSLDKMETKINELEIKREGAYSSMQTVLEAMQVSAQKLDKGTQNLISALKSSSTRGRYGEIGLRRVVEYAGMTEHCDFVEQATVQSEGGLLRPDMIINLPEKKTIIVDSKTPLDAYMKAFETEKETERQMFLTQHAVAVKDHLKNLSTKGYWSQFPSSPDYVILYMQIESSFAAALQVDPTLIEEGIRHNIIVATPTTLITLLRTVGFVWQQRSVAENIDQIRETGIELYNRTTVLLKHFSNIGGGLQSAVTHFNNAVASLESRFTPQARKLHALGSAYTRNVLPEIQPVDVAIREVSVPENSLEMDENESTSHDV